MPRGARRTWVADPSGRTLSVRVLALALGLSASVGCAGGAKPTAPGQAPARPLDVGRATRPDAAATLPLEIRITPVPARNLFEVRIDSGLSEGNSNWELPKGALSLSALSFNDESGELSHKATPASQGALRVALPRTPRGTVTARYEIAAHAFAAERPLAPSMDPNQARLSGEAVLLLPEGSQRAPVPVHLFVNAKGFGSHASVVSTIGLGANASATLSNVALWASTVLVGQVGVAEFSAPEGQDRAGWLGYSSFDPRQVAAEVAGFRSGARQYFGAKSAAPSTLLLFSDARKPGQFDARRRAGGVLVQVGLMQRWDGPLRIAVMQQLMREWIGAELAIAPSDADFPLERAWFVDGFNRSVTRELLFRFGLLTPEEFRNDVEQMLRIYTTSPLKKTPLHALGPADPDAAAAIIVARGALYALVLDGAIRKKSGGKRSLHHVIKDLYARARKKGAPLDPKTFVLVVQSELGEHALKLDSGVLRGDSVPVVPLETMGPCFTKAKRRYEVYDPGFAPSTDEEGTTVATQVAAKGSAWRAGLREGEVIKVVRYVNGDLERDVVLDVQRGDKTVRLSYRPSGGFVTGQGFDRKPKLPDSACNRGR